MRKTLSVLVAVTTLAACGGSENKTSSKFNPEEFERDFKMVDTVKTMSLPEIDAYANKLVDEGELCFVFLTEAQNFFGTLIFLLKDEYDIHTAIFSAQFTPQEDQEKIIRMQRIMDEAIEKKYGENFKMEVMKKAQEMNNSDQGFKFTEYNYQDLGKLSKEHLSEDVLSNAVGVRILINAEGKGEVTAILDSNENELNVDEAALEKMTEGLVVKSPVMWKGKAIPWEDQVYIQQ